MRGESHRCLGHYLAERYMQNIPAPYTRSFLLGCITPDRNPATYLKGSIRSQWLRGHNYGNASRYIYRMARKLERKKQWQLPDFYALGKLIHYTADSFTYAHNQEFCGDLTDHLAYETKLQHYFLSCLKTNPATKEIHIPSIVDTIRIHHREYIHRPMDIRTDTQYILQICCAILTHLIPLIYRDTNDLSGRKLENRPFFKGNH